jgi:hypothetical protein
MKSPWRVEADVATGDTQIGCRPDSKINEVEKIKRSLKGGSEPPAAVQALADHHGIFSGMNTTGRARPR